MRPFRLTLILLLVLVVLNVVGFPAQAQGKGPAPVGLRPDAPDYAKHGPYWVGVREFVIPDKDGKRPLPVTVWYPALNPDGKAEKWTVKPDYVPVFPNMEREGYAVQDAAPELKGGPYPLVVISPAHWTARYDTMDYTEHLASYGFVTVAVDHTDDTPANAGTGSLDVLVNRPRDISRVIDYAELLTAKGGTLAGVIEADHVATMGRDYGGWTALMSAGARWDLTAFGDFCTKNPQSAQASPNDWCMFFVNSPQNLASLIGLKVVPTGLWPSLGDPRVKAIVPLSPYSAASLFGQEGLKEIRVPALLMAGSGLTQTTMDGFSVITYRPDLPGYDTAKTFEYLSNAPASFVLFENAGQGIFGDRWERYSDKIKARFYELLKVGPYEMTSDPIWDMARAHDLINHFTTAFLLDVLKGDKDAHKALLPDAVKFAGIEYKTTMK